MNRIPSYFYHPDQKHRILEQSEINDNVMVRYDRFRPFFAGHMFLSQMSIYVFPMFILLLLMAKRKLLWIPVYIIALYLSHMINQVLKYNIISLILKDKEPTNLFERILYESDIKIPFRGLRPEGASNASGLPNFDLNTPSKFTYGMPSGHAQFAMMNMTFVLYLIYKENSYALEPSVIQVFVYTFAMIYIGLVICYSRYIMNVHTSAQVIIGGIIGITLGKMITEIGSNVLSMFGVNEEQKFL